MTKQSEHIKFQERTAEECRAVADAHAQELKGFWKRFAVSGLFVIAVVVIIFASLAWFAANNNVGGTSSTISAKAARYSISGAENGQAGVYDTQFATNDSLNVSATYNLNNYTSGGSLRPGSYGVLEVTVTPVATDVGNITLTLERNIKTRDSATLTDSEVAQLQNLFRGHVLFFQSRDENGYYSDPILNNTLTIEAREFCEKDSSLTTKAVTRHLYWVWPSQFSSYVLTGQINYNKNLFEDTESTGYQNLLDSINDNKDRFFSAADMTTLPKVTSSMTSANLETCTDAYNAGDELLGTNAEYLQIRFVGEEAAN